MKQKVSSRAKVLNLIYKTRTVVSDVWCDNSQFLSELATLEIEIKDATYIDLKRLRKLEDIILKLGREQLKVETAIRDSRILLTKVLRVFDSEFVPKLPNRECRRNIEGNPFKKEV